MSSRAAASLPLDMVDEVGILINMEPILITDIYHQRRIQCVCQGRYYVGCCGCCYDGRQSALTAPV